MPVTERRRRMNENGRHEQDRQDDLEYVVLMDKLNVLRDKRARVQVCLDMPKVTWGRLYGLITQELVGECGMSNRDVALQLLMIADSPTSVVDLTNNVVATVKEVSR